MSRIEQLIEELCPDLPAGRQVGWTNPIDLPCENNKWYTYVILCENGTLYKGFTHNLKSRYIRHLNGDGAIYTKKHKPVCVIYFEQFDDEQTAVNREKYFKSGSGREWLKLKIREIYEQAN
ncbi:MAG: GIY-YIG nuclease family protein [Paludibacteraceae bacterium]